MAQPRNGGTGEIGSVEAVKGDLHGPARLRGAPRGLRFAVGTILGATWRIVALSAARGVATGPLRRGLAPGPGSREPAGGAMRAPGHQLRSAGSALLATLLLVLGAPSVAPARAADDGPAADAPRPPLTPRWVYEPWAWEDDSNTAQAVRDLVAGYRTYGIPLGAVIVDSPWETNYNTFQFGPNYPDPAGFIGELHAEGVRVVLWTTGFLNVSSVDGPGLGKTPGYDQARAAGYFVDTGRTYRWWKGLGSAIDFFNPDAVAWWYRQLDRAFRLGADGWKVDASDSQLPPAIMTAAGPRPAAEYGRAYYRALFRYVAERSPEAIIMARPYDDRFYAPVDANPAGWVGDQTPDWPGLQRALDNILVSAEGGYAVVGSDIGGYLPGPRPGQLFVRWAQLGALSPFMENGGTGEHRPWQLGPDVLSAYRYYAKLHHELVPYLYSAGLEAHLTGRPIIRDVDRGHRQYRLGEDLLVAPLVTDQDRREIALPAGRWYDYWDDDRVLSGPVVVRWKGLIEQIPLFIRAGAMVPLQVEDAETGSGGAGSAGCLSLLAYPDGDSARTAYLGPDDGLALDSRRDAGGVTIGIGPHTERYVLRIKELSPPAIVTLARPDVGSALEALPSWETFDAAAEGWYYDAARHRLWVRFATDGTGARLTYTTPS